MLLSLARQKHCNPPHAKLKWQPRDEALVLYHVHGRLFHIIDSSISTPVAAPNNDSCRQERNAMADEAVVTEAGLQKKLTALLEATHVEIEDMSGMYPATPPCGSISSWYSTYSTY